MKTMNLLQLKFETPLWSKVPEFAVIGTVLDECPHIIKIVEKDVTSGLKGNNKGRGDNPTVEQVLRLALYKEMRGLKYGELEFHQYDSILCKSFTGIEKGFSDSCLQGYISKIKAERLNLVMVEINKQAQSMGIEDFSDIRIDSTPVECDIHRPTNNSLVYDCIKTATRFYEKIQNGYAGQYQRMECLRAQAKKLNYGLNNVNGNKSESQTAKEAKQAKMKSLFTDYLDIFQQIKAEIETLINGGLEGFSSRDRGKITSLRKNMAVVYKNAYRFQIEGEKVENADKIFSIYEEHTAILVKGLRDVIFGHKVNLATGKSNLILFCSIEDGNPSDVALFEEPIEEISKSYGVEKFSGCSTDGGYASSANMDFAKNYFTNIVFTKVVGSLVNFVQDPQTENRLKRWRAGIEANISNLKRGFNLKRVLWKGKAMFDAKVFWSVIAYNIRVMTGHILEMLKAA